MTAAQPDDRADLERRLAACEAELQKARQRLARAVASRTRSQSIARRSGRTLARLLEHAPIAIIGLDSNANVTIWNAAAEHLFGWGASEVLGRSAPTTATQAWALFVDIYRQAIGSATSPVIIQCCRNDGVLIDVAVTSTRLEGLRGQPTESIGMLLDLSGWRRAQAELTHAYSSLEATTLQLQHSRDLFQTLFDGLEDGFLLLDGGGIIQTVNRAMASMFMFSPADVIGRHWSSLSAYAGFDVPGMVVLQTLYDGRPRRRRETYTQPNRGSVVVDVQTFALTGRRGEVENVVLHLSDVTERIHFETLAIQNERFAASGQLIATIAHELNTPLLSIQSCLFLAEQAAGPSRDTYLTLAREEIDRISAILRQLLDVHRPDTGDLVDVAINPLIDRILLLTGGMLAEHHVMIIRALSDAHLVVRGYPNQLTQVMLNLVVNAIDAMPEGGQITLQTSRTNRWPEHLRGPLATLEPEQHVIVITISDTGKGIHPEIREEIFRPFFTTRAMGTGLGLAISQQIVQRHGGAMGLQSQLGYGSTFLVALPAV